MIFRFAPYNRSFESGIEQKGFSGNTDERTGLRICL